MKIWGYGGIAPRILNLGSVWRWVISLQVPADLHPGKYPPVSVKQKSRTGRSGKKSLPLPGIELRSSGP